MTQTFASVWDAIMDTPEEAAAMKVRSNLMMAIESMVRSWNVTQREAARRLGITQPRLNDLLKGKISNFSLDAPVSLAPIAGLQVEVNARPAPTQIRHITGQRIEARPLFTGAKKAAALRIAATGKPGPRSSRKRG
jgi:predicted XRE-type DNA-binding protein